MLCGCSEVRGATTKAQLGEVVCSPPIGVLGCCTLTADGDAKAFVRGISRMMLSKLAGQNFGSTLGSWW